MGERERKKARRRSKRSAPEVRDEAGDGLRASRRTELLRRAVDSAISTGGGWPVPAADPFAVLQRAHAVGLFDIGYEEALDLLQEHLALLGYPPFQPPLRWTAPGV